MGILGSVDAYYDRQQQPSAFGWLNPLEFTPFMRTPLMNPGASPGGFSSGGRRSRGGGSSTGNGGGSNNGGGTSTPPTGPTWAFPQYTQTWAFTPPTPVSYPAPPPFNSGSLLGK